MSDSEEETECNKPVTRQRGDAQAAITRFRSWMGKFDPESGNDEELEMRLDEAVSNQLVWKDCHQKVVLDCTTHAERKKQNEKLILFEDLYFAVVSQAKKVLKKIRQENEQVSNIISATPIHQVTGRSSMNLGPLVIAPFDGDRTDWLRFKHMFTTIMGKLQPSPENIEKLHRLKQSCTGDAINTISGVMYTDLGFDIAWELLTAKYEDIYTLATIHTQKLLDLERINTENGEKLSRMIDIVCGSLAALTSLEVNINNWDLIIITIVTSKLDNITRKEWQNQLSDNKIPNWAQMLMFLQKKVRTLISTSMLNNDQSKATSSKAMFASNGSSCIKCGKQHSVDICQAFKSLPLSQKYEVVRRNGACFNCLDVEHGVKDCPSLSRCTLCGSAHHTLLHSDKKYYRGFAGHVSQEKSSQVVLATALVYIYDNAGAKHICRALLDIGSQEHFMTEELAQRLKLRKRPACRPIEGVNSSTSRIDSTVLATIQSTTESVTKRLLFLVAARVTSPLPNHTINIKHWRIPHGVQLADPRFYQPSKVDILLGGGVFSELLKDGRIKLATGQPFLLNTQLGWIVSGATACQQSTESSQAMTSFCGLISNQQLSEQVEKLFKFDEIKRSTETTEEKTCEEFFVNTTTRGADGRYVVCLPLKENVSDLGNSRWIALSQLQRLLTRLDKNPQLRELYEQFMAEYEQLGHMEEIAEENDGHQSYYLPHHGVLKMSNSSSKLRVVFNGSQSSSTGYSINDLTYNGGLVQEELFDIAIWFRFFLYTFGSDAEKMYRQTWVHPKHQRYQRILWQRPGTFKVSCFQLKTITYGTKSAPHLATRALKQLALDSQDAYPNAARAILHHTYVDDILGGADTLEQAKQQKIELQAMLASASIRLHKWCSNDVQLLEDIPLCDREPLKPATDEAGGGTLKALGINWNPGTDTLFYEEREKIPPQLTKRDVLSLLSSTFDPLGLVSPFMVRLRSFMQLLWKKELDWNESMPNPLLEEWNNLVSEAKQLKEISIPRCVKIGTKSVQLVGFCDASQIAMCASIYVRSEDHDGKIAIRLLCSKTKVAPLGDATIPRLELNSALMLAELVNRVTKTLKLDPSQIQLFTDSMIVLAWLKKNVSHLKTFVHNRVKAILVLTEHMTWCHVRTNENPADLGSRGMMIRELKSSNLWWHGPSFLHNSPDNWPKSLFSLDITKVENEVNQEMKPASIILAITRAQSKIQNATNPQTQASPVVLDKIPSRKGNTTFIENCSRFTILTRAVARMLRWIPRNRKNTPLQSEITADELQLSTNLLLRFEQKKYFPEELKDLTHCRSVSNHSKLKSLNPFLDENGIIRVGGRLDNAEITPDARHPIVLPSSSHLALIMARTAHKDAKHIGQLGLLAIFRQKYWPIHGRTLMRKVTQSCIICFKVTPTVNHQQMGQLPQQRVVQSFPFQHVGVDFGGPFYIKQGGSRSTKLVKVYLCLFVCQATKAVHLELVSDLSTNSFISCLHRFIARRGLCSDIYSDNGTNFVGANRELKALYKHFCSEHHNKQLVSFCAPMGIKWHFNPAGSPHFGGLFEAGIKQAKVHIRRISGNASLTFEELTTLFAQVEAVLNSRPLTAISNDPNDFAVLTPGHLVLGREPLSICEPSLDHLKESYLSRHQRLNKLRRHFWTRWSQEYITQCQQRNKWQTGTIDLAIGQLALIRDENLPPLQWRLGRITTIHPGTDGITRAVTLKTKSGDFTRATHKISVLPCSKP